MRRKLTIWYDGGKRHVIDNVQPTLIWKFISIISVCPDVTDWSLYKIDEYGNCSDMANYSSMPNEFWEV